MEGVNALSHQCISGENSYAQKICSLGLSSSLLNGNDRDQFLEMKWKQIVNFFLKVSYAPWGGLEIY